MTSLSHFGDRKGNSFGSAIYPMGFIATALMFSKLCHRKSWLLTAFGVKFSMFFKLCILLRHRFYIFVSF